MFGATTSETVARIPLPFKVPYELDLVDFDGMKLLMFKNDNLYRIAISDDRKNNDVQAYQLTTAKSGYPPSVVTPMNVDSMVSARHGIFVYLSHLWRQDIDFTVFDVGSHIGDFGLKLGNFIRTCGKSNRVICFDPTDAGVLSHCNIELNGLGGIVRHEYLAVSDFNGLLPLMSNSGHSDSVSAQRSTEDSPRSLPEKLRTFYKSSNKLQYAGRIKPFLRQYLCGQGPEKVAVQTIIARSITLPDYLLAHSITGHLVIKIDLEGLDSRVLNTLLERCSHADLSVIMEFTPRHYTSPTATEYLSRLSEHFVIYDIFYCPNPTRLDRITSDKLADFTEMVSTARQFAYTDILLIPKSLPGLDQLLLRLDALERSPDSYVL